MNSRPVWPVVFRMNVSREMSLPALVASVAGRPSRRAAAPLLPVNPLEQSGWDDLVAEHPQATFFHGTAWARVLRDTYGHAPMYFCRLAGGRLEALLPVMEVSSPWTGRRGVSLPFTDLCPPLRSLASLSSPDHEDLFTHALEHGRLRRWKYLECRGGAAPIRQATPSLAFYGHTINLDAAAPALFARLGDSVRRGIRKSEAAGLSVKFGNDLAALRTYYDLHCQTRRRHGLPPQPFRFFENIGRHVLQPGHGWVVSVERDGRPLASAIFFHFARQALYKFGASDYAFQHLRPNNLLMWEAIKYYATHGCASLHLGRTSLAHGGLRHFKLGFGAHEERLDYFRYDFARAAFVADVDRVGGWFNPVFRALPRPLLRLAGAVLYPHLS